MTKPVKKIRPAKCSICDEHVTEKYRPFCSKRCSEVDLGRWLTGRYAISGSDDAEEDGLVAPQDLVFQDPEDDETTRH